MRIVNLMTFPLLLGALIALPSRAPAQVGVRVDPRLGPEVSVTSYSADRQGDWRTSAGQWQLATLYVVNDRFYPNHVGAARAIEVYKNNGETFLPPENHEWVGTDSRYNNDLRPSTGDYDHVRAIEHPVANPNVKPDAPQS
jgi:hypothetical protein